MSSGILSNVDKIPSRVREKGEHLIVSALQCSQLEWNKKSLMSGKPHHGHLAASAGRPARYRKIASSNTSCLETHVGLFRLLMKEILGPYVL